MTPPLQSHRSKLKTKDNIYFFNWDSLHARLNSHYKAWGNKKKKYKKIKAYRKSVYKESTKVSVNSRLKAI